MTSSIGSLPPSHLLIPVADPSGPARAPATPARVQTPPTAPQPSHPHLSDYSQTDRLREDIARQAATHPSFYGSLVGMVDRALQMGGFGISPASHQSVMDNLRQVNQGTIPQSTAHFREAGTFAQDALQSFRRGRVMQGGMELLGVGLNSVGGMVMAYGEEEARRATTQPYFPIPFP